MKRNSNPAVFLAATALSLNLVACGAKAPAPPAAIDLAIPAAAGSIAPNLSTGHGDAILLSWIEPSGDGHALKFSQLLNDTWSTPGIVAHGDDWFVNWADFPSVVAIADDLWAAHWLVSQPSGGYAYDVHTAFSNDRGETWSEPFIPHTDGTPTEHGFVTLFDDSGDLGMLWLDGRKTANAYDASDVSASGMTLRAGTFGKDAQAKSQSLVDDLICDCCQTDVAWTRAGPVVAYRDRTTNERRDIYVSRRVSGQWLPGIAVAEDEWTSTICPVNGPAIQADGDSVAVAWFTGANDLATIKVAWSTDAGRSFANPTVVDTRRPLGHVASVLLPSGNLAMSWIRSNGAGGGQLVLRQVAPNGELGEEVVVEQAQHIMAFSVPQLARQGDNLIATWTTEADGVPHLSGAVVPLAVL